MAEPVEKLRQVRLEKLEKIRNLGVDPFPAFWEPLKEREPLARIRELSLGDEVVAAGRIMALRSHGGMIFADLHDLSDQIQLCFRQDKLPKEQFAFLEFLDIGDFLGVKGKLFKTKAGELTISVKEFKLLTKSLRPLPSQWYGLEDVETRYRQRYLDLVLNPEVKETFITRTKILTELRNFLDAHGFWEVETPVLQPIYGGALARPFITHHNALDIDLYLRISNELYLKRLIVGGFEKIYEVCKDFRNEGIDRQHNPEFTMIEFYWAYANYERLMEFTEVMIKYVLRKIVGTTKINYQGKELDFTPPLPKIPYQDLIKEHTGISLDSCNAEKKLLEAIKKKGISLDLEGVAGYGPLVDALYKETCRPKLIQPIFLIDHPAETVALAKRKEEDPSQVARFQLVVNTYEIVNAYNELNDPIDQRGRWLESESWAKRGLEAHEVLDEDYIRALEYGMPPTAGWGMGVDRFVALITDQPTIKEVLLFPTMRPEDKNG